MARSASGEVTMGDGNFAYGEYLDTLRPKSERVQKWRLAQKNTEWIDPLGIFCE